jgi:hypothetical protein
MNESGKRFLQVNSEIQVAIARLMTELPTVTPGEWSAHLFFAAAAMASISGIDKGDAIQEAQYGIDIAYSTPVQHEVRKIH